MKNIRIVILSITIVFAGYSLVNAQGILSNKIDSLVELSMETFNVPGIAVAVVKDGKVIYSKGYGRRSMETKEKSTNTRFLPPPQTARHLLLQHSEYWWMKKNYME
jgi:CubicO group peptidase (beta-lactamase class C family)